MFQIAEISCKTVNVKLWNSGGKSRGKKKVQQIETEIALGNIATWCQWRTGVRLIRTRA